MGITFRLNAGLVFEGTTAGELISEAGSAPPFLDLHLAVGEFLSVAENRQGYRAILRTRDLHFDQKRFRDLRPRRHLEAAQAEVIALGGR